jgi:hypothetical protein
MRCGAILPVCHAFRISAFLGTVQPPLGAVRHLSHLGYKNAKDDHERFFAMIRFATRWGLDDFLDFKVGLQ